MRTPQTPEEQAKLTPTQLAERLDKIAHHEINGELTTALRNAWPTISRMLRAGEAAEGILLDIADGPRIKDVHLRAPGEVEDMLRTHARIAIAAYRASQGGGGEAR